MAFAITQSCCADASCVAACPVNCIHPTPDEPDFTSTDMLFVDPRACIDCGACADACPVDAVHPVERLTGPLAGYAEVNAAYYDDRPVAESVSPLFHEWGPPSFGPGTPAGAEPLDVAVVGTGPAGMYAARELLLHSPSRVTLIDRMATPGGLVRYGVAPDHPATRRIAESFAHMHAHPRVRMRLGVEARPDELSARHDAVVWAVGASASRELGVPGEELPGSVDADTVVGWYNGRPDVPADAVEPASRVVVVGTGNVAIDIARVLTADPDDLAGTPIAPHALVALRSGAARSGVPREVVLLGRRGPETVAATAPELRELLGRAAVPVVVDDHDPRIAPSLDGPGAGLLRDAARTPVDWSAPPAGPRVVFRFHSAPDRIDGVGRVRSVRTVGVDIPAGLVVRAVGHRGRPVPGLPFDDARGVIPHDAGRVAGRPGHYVVGWIKRGASGGIGANRRCAAETVGSLLDDAAAGRLPARRRPWSRWRTAVRG
ncbi:FAD-dependent oxidoreductase [Pseudonocardia nematodicida]|uniref:ferredoxin--NADP(+) reductase n=1 Tax=Pseudonocardia nematodicida TaxID=1206997 RepID=A0ABV1KHW9_9PSEU